MRQKYGMNLGNQAQTRTRQEKDTSLQGMDFQKSFIQEIHVECLFELLEMI
jgi:hypothetical protein